ncbi:hypothetical protein ACVW0Y_002233 [Pseudomonas sp. TE3786]
MAALLIPKRQVQKDNRYSPGILQHSCQPLKPRHTGPLRKKPGNPLLGGKQPADQLLLEQQLRDQHRRSLRRCLLLARPAR